MADLNAVWKDETHGLMIQLRPDDVPISLAMFCEMTFTSAHMITSLGIPSVYFSKWNDCWFVRYAISIVFDETFKDIVIQDFIRLGDWRVSMVWDKDMLPGGTEIICDRFCEMPRPKYRIK